MLVGDLRYRQTVPAKMLSAAGSAEFDPVAANSTSKQKEKNRRIEVVFVPKIEELPGVDQLVAQKEAPKDKGAKKGK